MTRSSALPCRNLIDATAPYSNDPNAQAGLEQLATIENVVFSDGVIEAEIAGEPAPGAAQIGEGARAEAHAPGADEDDARHGASRWRGADDIRTSVRPDCTTRIGRPRDRPTTPPTRVAVSVRMALSKRSWWQGLPARGRPMVSG